MRKLSPKMLMVIAVILSIITATLAYNYLKSNTQTKVTGQPVVVAVRDIPGRTMITADMVKTVNMPLELIQPESLKDPNKVIGVMTRVPINAGDQVTEKRLAIDGKVPGFVGAIPRDKRAFTIAATDITGVAGFVKAGDYVDVVGTFDKSTAGENVSALLLENVLVLAANSNDNMEADAKEKEKKESKMLTVTLAIAPEEAATLALAGDKGKIHLALRPFQTLPGFTLVNTVTTTDLVGFFANSAQQTTPAPTPAYTPMPSAPVMEIRTEPAAASSPSYGGIKLIKGTKIETVSVN